MDYISDIRVEDNLYEKFLESLKKAGVKEREIKIYFLSNEETAKKLLGNTYDFIDSALQEFFGVEAVTFIHYDVREWILKREQILKGKIKNKEDKIKGGGRMYIYTIHPVFLEFSGKSNKVIVGKYVDDEGYVLDGHHYLYKCLKEGSFPTIEYKEIDEKTETLLETLRFCFSDLQPLVDKEKYEVDNFQFYLLSFNYSYDELVEILQKYSKDYHLASQALSFVMEKQLEGIERYEHVIDCDYTNYLEIIWRASVSLSIEKGEVYAEIGNIEMDGYKCTVFGSPTELYPWEIKHYEKENKEELLKDMDATKMKFLIDFIGQLRLELLEICQALLKENEIREKVENKRKNKIK